VPNTRTRRQALFLVEELPGSLGTFGFGARVERAQLDSDGDADAAAPKFGPAASRRFTPKSVSLSQTLKAGAGWAFTGTLSRTERAPTSFELYANGVHAATGAYERGDAALGVERGTQLDVSARWGAGTDRVRISAFAARYSGFIALEATGQTVDVPDSQGNVETFPEYAFIAVPARLQGFEVDAARRLADGPVSLDLDGGIDLTRGSNRATGAPLPRIAPLRARLGLDAGLADWRMRFELVHAAAQRRVGNDDVATPGYTLLNLGLSRRWSVGATDFFGFASIDNLTDRLAYNATSIRTARELAPLPGRAIKAGLRVTF
jgi:iron complex outermembrane receptor protein